MFKFKSVLFKLFLTILWVWGAQACAQFDYPSRPIRIVVGYPPGQTVDVSARAYAQYLSQALGQGVYVDNKPGANGILAANIVKQAAPDGYTLLYGASGQLGVNPAIYENLPYDPVKDFTAIALGAKGRLYMVVPAASPFHTVRDLIAYAKQHPGKLSYGSGGVGITANLAMESFKSAAGIDILHVPYKGSPAALTDLIGGQVQVMLDAGALVLPQIENGKLRALAVSSKTRYAKLPDVPTLSEAAVPGFEVVSWSALVGPAGMPPQITARLHDLINQASQDEKTMAIVRAGGSEPDPLSQQEFAQFVKDENARWIKVARDAGVPKQ